MTIHCTKKLLDQLKCTPAEVKEETPLFSWHANLLTIHRRKAVYLLNDEFRYAILLYGLKAPDFKNLSSLILDSIKESFIREGIDSPIVEQYIQDAKAIQYTKTSNRSLLSALSQSGNNLHYYSDHFNNDQIPQIDFNLFYSGHYQRTGGELIIPRDYLHEIMNFYAAGGKTSPDSNLILFRRKPTQKKQKAFILDVWLPLGVDSVRRTIAVPASVTFRKLHKILQVVFDWHNYHMHEFVVLSDINEVVAISESAMDGFLLEEGSPMAFFKETARLSEYFPEYHQIVYTYDFGDDWQHYIDLEQIIDDYNEPLPTCLSGNGNAPPEDVGGVHGYLDFLDTIANPNSPDRQDMLAWAEEQGWQNFDIQKINTALKRLK